MDWMRRSWWVVVFVAVSAFLYVHGMHAKGVACKGLEQQRDLLLQEKQALLSSQEDLRLQQSSQEDPAWIELVLMRRMGVVPEGQRKVYFDRPEGS